MNGYSLEEKLKRIGEIFRLKGKFYSYTTLTSGNVNGTYRVYYLSAEKALKIYVIQRINSYVFRNPEQIMSNIEAVTSHIRKKSGSNGATLHFHHTAEGKNYYLDGEGSFWRLYDYVDANAFDTCTDLTILKNAGIAFGEFQMQLSDFDASCLYETIPDFHHTKKRMETLFRNAEQDICGRKAEVLHELAYLAEMRELAEKPISDLEAGILPLRVTHNDTKINNVLFDKITKMPLLVIDLDTVMPGLAVYDFGDAVRFAANTACEDEADLSCVSLDLSKFKAFAEGFIGMTKTALTKAEIDSMSIGTLAITLELASRFLDDYLTGDRYFKVNYEGHNLVRTRCQLKLAEDIHQKLPQMNEIIKKIADS